MKKYSEHFACVDCGLNFEELSPRMFSFNAPQGACPECNGIGSKMEMDPDLIVPNRNLSLNEGAIAPWASSTKKKIITIKCSKQYLIISNSVWTLHLMNYQANTKPYYYMVVMIKFHFHLNVEINHIWLIVNLKVLFQEWRDYTLKQNQTIQENISQNL